MMTKEENDQLTQVGPGTPMGDVLRLLVPGGHRPGADEFPVKRTRLGEDWAVFKTGDGGYGIVDERCPTAGRRSSTASSTTTACAAASRLEVRHQGDVRRHPGRAGLVAGVPGRGRSGPARPRLGRLVWATSATARPPSCPATRPT